MCKGSLILGTGCGVCSRCVEESGLSDAWIENAYGASVTTADRAKIRRDIVALRAHMRAEAANPDNAYNRPAGAKWGMGDLVKKKRGYACGIDMAYWDCRSVYGGYAVECLWLYPGCRVSIFDGGESFL